MTAEVVPKIGVPSLDLGLTTCCCRRADISSNEKAGLGAEANPDTGVEVPGWLKLDRLPV